jgi:purine-nucleoside phosphorylase
VSIAAYDLIQRQCRHRPPVLGVVLGSGLNEIADCWSIVASASFAEIPGMPHATVAGHRGRLTLHEFDGGTVLVFQGRVHFYEGHDTETVTAPILISNALGVPRLILTNAAGGIGAAQCPGSLMLITRHLLAIGRDWWKQVVPQSPYSKELGQSILQSAANCSVPLSTGTYACLTGPSYETPAEIRALRSIGADAVGMSTAIEAKRAAHCGMSVAGVSCIANWAAGISPTPLSHHEVLETVRTVAESLKKVIESLLLQL